MFDSDTGACMFLISRRVAARGCCEALAGPDQCLGKDVAVDNHHISSTPHTVALWIYRVISGYLHFSHLLCIFSYQLFLSPLCFFGMSCVLRCCIFGFETTSFKFLRRPITPHTLQVPNIWDPAFFDRHFSAAFISPSISTIVLYIPPLRQRSCAAR